MIQTETALQILVQRALEAPRVAIDTEFIWERTFYPRLGLIQVGFTEEDCELIDTVALPKLPSFGRLLESTQTEKILHDAQQDLSILARITQTTPQNIFDTRRAAGFSQLPSTTSLMALLRDVLNIDIPKTETRSNWLRRPLSDKQIEYALNDVRFLPLLRDTLVKRAADNGNLNHLTEEMESFNSPDYYRELTPEEVFQRMKVGRLQHNERTALRELVKWREGIARTRDLPRGHVLRDADLFTLAKRKPTTLSDLQRIEQLPRSATTHHANGILESIALSEDAATATKQSMPPNAFRLPPSLKGKIPKRIAAMQKKATEAGIDPAMVASKAAITELIAAEHATPPQTHALHRGWRQHFVS